MYEGLQNRHERWGKTGGWAWTARARRKGNILFVTWLLRKEDALVCYYSKVVNYEDYDIKVILITTYDI